LEEEMKRNIREAAAKFAVLLLGLILLAGCSNPSSSSSGPDKEVDVVVVGSGIAGIMAAIGAKVADPSLDVLLIEKGAFGGTTRRAAGGFSAQVYAVESQSANNYDTARTVWIGQVDPATDTGKETSATTGYPDLDKYVEVAKENKRVRDYMRDTTNGLSVPGAGTGATVIAQLETQITAKEIELLMDCRATSIVMEGGAAAGILATYNGDSSYWIKAKNVIIATGGFSHNLELVTQWAGTNPGLKDVVSLADPGSTGDGIVMAMAAGAKQYNNTFTDAAGIQYSSVLAALVADELGTDFSIFSQPTWNTASPLSMRYQMLVNNEGKRFINEATSNGAISYNAVVSRALIRANKAPYYVIFDATNANITGTGVFAGGGTYVVNDALDAGVALTGQGAGEVVKGNTLADLAGAMGLTGQAATDFVAEVAKYNGFVTATTDDDFNKPAASLTKKIETGPFYAVKLYPNTFGSMGGVVTAAQGRVLNSSDNPIPHLYAAGEVSNRDFYNQVYPGGASLALYSTIGYIAGETAAVDN
jgi:fumarate reductase flavoprotein subunit